jgi:isopentenyl-diphosphate delta-isomerase
MPKPPQTESRKKDHVEFVLKKGAQYEKTTGFEHVDLVHNALPEMSLDEVDLSTTFFGKKVSYPIIITAMTGGYKDAKKINRGLAEAAQKHGIALGLGSQRAMIEKPELADTYKVREVAPDIPILANIGACQLKSYPLDKIETIVSSVEADGLAIHLNPLQEVIQGEGDTDFKGVLKAVRKTCERLDVPIMVKETGAGMSQAVALKLKEAGVSYIDVAGAGGTSWSRVEYLRSEAVPGLEDWGLPTVESIMECRDTLPMVASGGIRNGVDGAKAIALGADMCGAAYPFLAALKKGNLSSYIEVFKKQMRICAFLTGSRNVAELKKAHLFIH